MRSALLTHVGEMGEVLVGSGRHTLVDYYYAAGSEGSPLSKKWKEDPCGLVDDLVHEVLLRSRASGRLEARVARLLYLANLGPGSYEVWQEGYCATGESEKARRLGVVVASSFRDAARIAFRSLNRRAMDDEDLCSDYGCYLYPTEAEARRCNG